MMPTTDGSFVASSPLTVYHRGFALAVLQTPGRYGPRSFGFEVLHRGLLLYTSPGEYGTASEAEGGARRFVDDALRAFGPFRRCATGAEVTERR